MKKLPLPVRKAVKDLGAELTWAFPLSLQVVPPNRVAVLGHDGKTICHIVGDLYAIQPFAHQAVTWINGADAASPNAHAKVVQHVMARLLADAFMRYNYFEKPRLAKGGKKTKVKRLTRK